MLNKDQYDILNFIKSHDITNPITCLNIINHPFYDGAADSIKTDGNLQFLADLMYINLDDSQHGAYRTGYNGTFSITSAGIAAMNDYDLFMSQKEAAEATEKKSADHHNESMEFQKRTFKVQTWLCVLTLIAAVLSVIAPLFH